MKFANPNVSVTQTEDYRWELNRAVRYYSRGTVVVVPGGYTTDFATVPRFVWWLVPTYGSYTAATVLHDYLITNKLPSGRISSRTVDRIFREAMRSLGVSLPRRWLMWAGVRWGAVFNKRRRPGSLGTLPGVLLISLVALPLVLPALAVLPSLLVFSLLEKVIG